MPAKRSVTTAPSDRSRNMHPEQTDLTRRRFLGAASAAIALPWFVPGTAKGDQPGGRPAPSNRITMALIGCGGMGRANLHAFLDKPEVQVIAVCDPDRSHRDAARAAVEEHHRKTSAGRGPAGCASYNDFRDVLARDDIDAVIQAAPDHWHALIVVSAARAGKDIYGEKPLSRTVEEGRIMSDAVRRYGRVFQTGSHQRSDSRFRHACELVRNGRIGEVRRARVGLPGGSRTGNHPPIPVPDGFDYDLWLGPAPWTPFCEYRTHYNFRHILDYSGGKLCDWGAHHIDIAQWALGTLDTGPLEIEGVGEYPRDGLWNAALNFHFTATYERGTQLIVDNRFEQGVKFEGDEGWVFVRRGALDAHPRSLLTSVIAPNEIHLHRSGDHRQNFLDCIRARREPAAPIEHAHRSITIAHLANIAMQLGRKLRWHPDAERIVGDDPANRMLGRAMRQPWRF